ncbi:hypothetical protein B0H19DRAFT_1366528 [Mycena capillaripes]|nr:hypothetical protein B0H19DRAFT_1366528 [Mycena capillaripes]
MAQFCSNCGAPPLTLPPLLDPAVSSTDLTHLLSSNNPPLESEIPSIRDIISQGEERIPPLDAHIDALKAPIQVLRTSLAHLYDDATKLRSSSASINPSYPQFTVCPRNCSARFLA